MGFSTLSIAQSTEKINIVTTSVPFLRISSDARAGGMGETGIATSPDANAQFYNVAKYAFAESKTGIGMTYTPWLKKLGLNDVYLASLAGYYKIGDDQAFSASLKYFSLGNLQISDNDGNALYTQRPSEMSVDAGYSRKLSPKISMGLAARYIHSDIAGNSSQGNIQYKAGNAFSADLGLYYSTVAEGKSGWSAGAALSNLGTKISYSSDAGQENFLPANVGGAAGYTWAVNEAHKLTINAEANKLLVPVAPANATEDEYRKYNETGVIDGWISSFGNKAMSYAAGGEYVYAGQFSLRAGYYRDTRSLGKRNYFTTGFGVKYNILDFNFSYVLPSGTGINSNPLSNTIRFSLIFSPGAAK
ncbi:MAG: type IX secretion system outer membrane channel protein PorV [Gemmatimonadaceae bacterium]|nr:type IX secretion system outer membrane channel protein PorV [Chitinophagaceae bacterium]